MTATSNSQSENSNILQKEIKCKDELDKIKFWKNRIKFDTKLKYAWIIIWGVFFVLHFYFLTITGQEIVIPIFDIILPVTYFYGLYMESLIKGQFEQLVYDSQGIFESIGHFKKYAEFVREKFKSKTEKYLPIFFYFIWFAIAFFIIDVPGRLISNYYGRAKVQLPENLYIFNILKTLFELVFLWSTWILIVGSALILIIITFICINRLGNDEYRLKVQYQDLKIGAFEEIGKFVISLSIPSILLSTTFSVTGLIFVLLYNDFMVGYALLFVGLGITLIFSGLLYKNTINLHKAITEFKFDLKYNLIEEIQNITSGEEGYDLNKVDKYGTIKNIHDYYEKIDDINDWPFNPKSIRKLAITFFSSILPILLSFFGFA